MKSERGREEKGKGIAMAGVITVLFALWGAAPASTSRPERTTRASHAVAGERPSICALTANRMSWACAWDIREEFSIADANCLNLSDRAERIECRQEAHATRIEESELCGAQYEARLDVCELLDEDRYDPDPLLDPEIDFIDPDDIPDLHDANPYFSLVAGHTYVLLAGEEEEETVVVHVTERTREIQGVLCRVVVDAVVEVEEDEDTGEVEYEAVEVTDDWYAQDEDGNVYYCGELSRNFADGMIEDLEGSFEAGKDFAKSGVLVRAVPVVEDAHRQEFALGEAEDLVEYVDLAATPSEEIGGENPSFPCAGACLQTRDLTPLEPEGSEFKFYLADVGFVLAAALEDGEPTGEREVLVCVGDSLEVLEDESCGIENLEALLEALCARSPDTFCAE